jgi:hypothetical protein
METRPAIAYSLSSSAAMGFITGFPKSFARDRTIATRETISRAAEFTNIVDQEAPCLRAASIKLARSISPKLGGELSRKTFQLNV